MPPPRPTQVTPDCTQIPDTQQPPLLQVLPAQQVVPGAPQAGLPLLSMGALSTPPCLGGASIGVPPAPACETPPSKDLPPAPPVAVPSTTVPPVPPALPVTSTEPPPAPPCSVAESVAVPPLVELPPLPGSPVSALVGPGMPVSPEDFPPPDPAQLANEIVAKVSAIQGGLPRRLWRVAARRDVNKSIIFSLARDRDAYPFQEHCTCTFLPNAAVCRSPQRKICAWQTWSAKRREPNGVSQIATCCHYNGILQGLP